MGAQLKGPSGTVLEQTTSCDGLVQLMPRKRKAGDAAEDHVGFKGSGVFAQGAVIPPVVQEGDKDGFSRPDISSGLPPAPVTNTTQTPVPETPATPLREQEPQPGHPEQMREMEFTVPVTRPTHVDLPPPPEPKTLSSPQKPPGPSANRSPQIDIMPGLPVLVVDDDKMTRTLFERMLGRLKCSVTTAVNGYEALQLITGDQNVSQTPAEEEHDHLLFSDGDDHTSITEKEEKEKEGEEKESKFAIVFLDNQMPVMSGVEMVRKLRKLGRKDLVVGVTGEFRFYSTPSVYLSVGSNHADFVGNALLPDQEEYLGAGVDFILTKPVREENVRKMLTIANERKKARSLRGLTPTAPPPDATKR